MISGPILTRNAFGFRLSVELRTWMGWQGSVRPIGGGSVVWMGLFKNEEEAKQITYAAAHRLASQGHSGEQLGGDGDWVRGDSATV